MDMKAKIDCICEIQDIILAGFKSEVSNGLMNMDAKEAGEVTDIINDLAETEKNLREACYYETVTKAMKEESEENFKMGYTPRWKPKVGQEPYVNAYLHDPDFKDNMRMGYVEGLGNDTRRTSENGAAYDNYRDAKRHYTQTKSSSDKDMMDMYANEHLTKTLATLKEMWADADTSTKSRMKTELSSLITSMTV